MPARSEKKIETVGAAVEPEAAIEVQCEELSDEEIEEDQAQTAFFDCKKDMEGGELQTGVGEQARKGKK